MRFTGEYLDPSGLYHLRARQYDPAVGRFQRPDPIDTDVSSPYSASYIYAANRPTSLVDPSGLTPQTADYALRAASIPTSLEEIEAPSPRLTRAMLANARIIFTLGRRAGLSKQRSREMVAAAYKESSLIGLS